MSSQTVIQIGCQRLEIRTDLPPEHLGRMEKRIADTLDAVGQGRTLPEPEHLCLGLLALTDELLEAEGRIERLEEARQRLEALIRRVESAF